MAVPLLIEKYKKLRTEPAWKLLAADTAPEILAILQTLLFDTDRRLKESVMIEKLLRIYNDMETGTVTRETVTAKLATWRKEGYLSRTFMEGNEEPYYELLPGAFDAISFVSSQTAERIAPTSSRLSLLLFALRKLVDDTDTDIDKRLARLEQEKRAIERRMEQIRQGNIEPIPDLEVRSQIQDILNLLESMDGDFLRVRDRLIKLSNSIHANILSGGDSVGGVLEEVFKGYDAIQQSDEGKTFDSFYKFLLGELTNREVDGLIDALESRWFWQDLQPKDSEALSDLVSNLNARSRETLLVMKSLASGLRQLVQNRNYLENRRLQQLLKEVRKLSVTAVTTNSADIKTEIFTMDQPYVRLSSAGMGVLYDPSVSRTETTLGVASAPDLNWVELGKRLNASEINFATLKSNIEAAIKIQSPITLGQILKMFPPKHGLATIVGYLHLAVEKAERKDDVKEIIDWENRWKEKTAASIPTFIFSLSNLDEEGKLL